MFHSLSLQVLCSNLEGDEVADAASTRVPHGGTQLTEKHTAGYAVSSLMSVRRAERDTPSDTVISRHSEQHSKETGYGARG